MYARIRLLHHSKKIVGGLEDPEIVQVAIMLDLLLNLACALMKCIPNSDKITTITNLIDSPNIMLAS